MTTARTYGVDASGAGAVGWCKCGWRTGLEDNADEVTHKVVRHRASEHSESSGTVKRRMGVAA